MKKLMICFLMATIAVAAKAQQEKKETATEKKQAEEQQRSLGGHKGENDGVLKFPERSSKEIEQENASSSTADPADSDGSGKRDESDTPAVIETTTSESGSPAILSENNGRGRDGTNSVQRSTPNMAGAKVPRGVKVDRTAGEQKTTRPQNKVLKQEQQPPAVGTEPTETAAEKKEEAEVTDEATVEPKDPAPVKEEKKKKRSKKSRRNRKG